jgi:uncharacterized membrane protein
MRNLAMETVHRAVNWIILIIAVLAVPFAHGILQHVGLILFAILLIALNSAIARKRMRAGGAPLAR